MNRTFCRAGSYPPFKRLPCDPRAASFQIGPRHARDLRTIGHALNQGWQRKLQLASAPDRAAQGALVG